MFAIQFEAFAAEDTWRREARCRDASGATTALFFSEQLDDIARAKAFCRACPVRSECLEGALARREPWGVWGGELLAGGKVLAQKRRRGRPPKVEPPEPAYDEWGQLVAEARSA
jgi:WhiB family redox-sensing transcriptional regulator